MKVNAHLDVTEIKKRLGIEPNGKVQTIIDTKLVDYLKEYEPVDSTQLQNNTRRMRPGLIVVATPYAHYQNVGEVYVDPQYGKGAFHDPVSGRFWSSPNVEKVPSGRKFSTYGAERGPRFVERTLNQRLDDIMRDIREGMKQ